MSDSLIPWLALNGDLANFREEILKEWRTLIDNPQTAEPEVVKFLRDHAGFALCDSQRKLVAIAELELGSDFRADFVVAEDQSSHGYFYEFIECESPNDRAFTKSGKPSSELVTAIMQIMQWRMWLAANREAAKKLLPSWEFWKRDRLAAKYTIVIGRRDESEPYRHVRNLLAEELSIEVRSFDYLTERIETHPCFPVPNLASTEMHAIDRKLRNQLVNPFRKAISSSTWRKIAPDLIDYHTTAKSMELLINSADVNDRCQAFLAALAALPPENLKLLRTFADLIMKP